VPATAAVVVAGDVDPARVLAMAERHYGRIAARPVPERKPREEPVQRGLRQVEVKAPADQAYTALQFKVPKLTSFESTPENDDALALSALAAVLDGHDAARLNRALTQGADRVADSVGAANGLWGRGPQLFTLDGVPAPGKTAQQVQAALRAEVERVAREGVTEAELQRVKTRWIASEVYKLDSLFNQARELGAYWAMGLPLDAGERLIDRLRKVTPAQVQSVAARYFGDDQLTIGTLRPLPRGAEPPPRRPPPGARH
jgi:zinc protease